jgi:hypothetical protein
MNFCGTARSDRALSIPIKPALRIQARLSKIVESYGFDIEDNGHVKSRKWRRSVTTIGSDPDLIAGQPHMRSSTQMILLEGLG